MDVSASALLAVFASLLFPGVGQGLAAHRRRGLLWALAGVISLGLIVTTVWFVVVTLVVRLACAADAYRCLKRAARGPASRAQRVSVAIAIVIGAVAGGSVRVVAVEGFKIPSSSMYPTLIIGDHVYVDKLTMHWRPPARGEVIVFEQPCAHVPYVKRVMAVGGDTIEVRCSVVYINGTPVRSTLVDNNARYQDRDDAHGEWFSRTASRYREVLDGHAFDTFRNPDNEERGDFPQRDRLLAPACTHGEFFDKPAAATTQPRGELVPTKDLATAGACEPQLHFVVPAGSVFVMGDNRHNANDSRFWGVVPVGNVVGRVIGIWLSDGPDGGWSRFGAIE